MGRGQGSEYQANVEERKSARGPASTPRGYAGRAQEHALEDSALYPVQFDGRIYPVRQVLATVQGDRIMTDHDFGLVNRAHGFSFTLRDFVAIGFRHKRLLVLSFSGLLLGTVLATVLIPPKYQGVTKILVKRERVDPVITSQRSDPMQVKEDVGEEELNSEIELIESDDVLRQTVI